MAKMNKGIFGPLSGKIGAIVGAIWRGIGYIRQAPAPQKKNVKRTAGQIANAQKMKFVNNLLMPFHPFVTVGFQNEAEGKTALSAAYSVNFHQAVTGVYPGLGVDYSKLCISKGKLPGLENPEMDLIGDDTFRLRWDMTENLKAVYNDQVMLVLYSPALHFADGFIGGALRRDLQCTFELHPKLLGQVLEVYVGVTSINRQKTANSIHLGTITI